MRAGAPLVVTAATQTYGMVIRLRIAGGIIGTGILAVACALAGGCGTVGSSTASHRAVVTVRHKARSHRFCVDELTEPTAAELAKINRYWTPLARSALTKVSQGKMLVTVPKKHLTPAQRRALNLAYRAEKEFSPKPKVVCEQVTRRGFPTSASAVPPHPSASAGA
jgi:hypothetical protein